MGQLADPSESVVFGVGLDTEKAKSVLEKLAHSNAAALVVKRDVVTEELQILADRCRVPLQELRPRLTWTEAYGFESILEDPEDAAGIEDLLYRSNDLPEFARALSERLGGNPLTIDSLQHEVLAHSAHDESIDHARRQTILASVRAYW